MPDVCGCGWAREIIVGVIMFFIGFTVSGIAYERSLAREKERKKLEAKEAL